MKKGKVYIAGAGPGDENLISVRAMELVKQADVIVYDRLAAERFLQYANKECEKINAGKQPQNHRLNQKQINQVLIEKAKEGKKVLRLKGGDPFLFGRGGEECEELQKAGISFEVIPGISSFYSVCAYAGIPVTHRNCASSFHVFTGHRAENEELDYKTIANMEGTLLFLMSMKNLSLISKKLIEQGKNEYTPTAVIQWGTTSKQKSVTAYLKDIAQVAEQQCIGHPSVVIIGDVVKQRMDWQKYRPLFGKHIVLAGSGESALESKKILQQEGAEVTIYSAIEIIEQENNLIQEMNRLHKYTWIFFTSVHSVKVFFHAMKSQKKDIRTLQGIGIYCIGEKTKEEVEEYKELASQGDAYAQTEYGKCLLFGKAGITPNGIAAYEWFQKAAAQSNEIAKMYLGHCKLYGIGTNKDENEDLVQLFWDLGNALEKSLGVAQNYRVAVYYFTMIDDWGHPEGAKRMRHYKKGLSGWKKID